MTDNDIRILLCKIKTFFPRFANVEIEDGQYKIRPSVTASWFDAIGWMEYDRAVEILNDYLQSEDGAKTPNVSLWMNNGKMHRSSVWHNARLDLRHGVIVWQPEGSDETYERKIVHDYDGTYEDEEGFLWAYAGGET